jgi:uncharacterized protein (TIGR02246 family)
MKAAQAVENTAETEIGDLIHQWRQAILDHDHDRIATFYASDILAFDAVDSLQLKGREAYRNAWQRGFEHLKGGRIVFDLAEVAVTAGEDVAFSTAMVRCGGTSPDGKEQTGWMRYTGCWRRQGGRWLVAHEHFSMPFAMADGNVMFNLEP